MKNVKKFMAVALAIVMAVAVLAGCGSNKRYRRKLSS